jgi:hypothetical protein
MALILLKQTVVSTGPLGDQYYRYFFNTETIAVQESGSRARELEPFEMYYGQLIYSSMGIDYRYDGDGGFYITEVIPIKTWPFTLVVEPAGAGTATDLTAAAPYQQDMSVSVLATPAPGYAFVSWTRNGAVLSTKPAYSYVIPFGGATLTANFVEVAPPPPLKPMPVRFYDLEIRVNGAQIPITGLVQRTISGIFSSDMEGDRSYPVNVPMTPDLMIALGNPNDPQSKTDFSKPFPAELWAHGNRLYTGHLDILKSDENQIRATFLLDSAFFISQNKAVTLPECYGPTDTISLTNQDQIAIGGYEIRFTFDYDVKITVNSSTRIFIKTAFENHLLMIEAVYDWLLSLGLGLEVTMIYSDDLTDELTKVKYWDTTVVTECTLEVFMPNKKFWQALRYSNPKKLTSIRMDMEPWNQFSEENRIAFPSVYNRELYEGNNTMHDGIVNRYDAAGNLFVSNMKYLTFSESFRWEHTLIPFIYLTDVVKAIFKKLKITVSGDEFFADDRVKRMLLYNNRTLDYVSVRLNNTPVRRTPGNVQQGFVRESSGGEYADNYWYENIHDFQIKLSNHVPEVSVVEFLKAMKNYFGLKYDFNILQNRVEIRFIRTLIRQRETLDFTRKAGRIFILTHSKETGLAFTYENPDPLLADGVLSSRAEPMDLLDPDTIADYQVTNYLALDSLDAEIKEIAYVKSLRAYFQLTTDQDDPPFWKLYAFVQQDDVLKTGSDGQTETRRSWSVGMVPLVDSFIYGRKMPAIECTANNPEVNLENKECGIRIFAFYGQQQDGANEPYAFASVTRYNAKELESESQYDLDIRSEDSMPFWKDLEGIVDRGMPYETTLILDPADFVRLSRTPIIRIANIDYLIDKLEVQHSNREQSIAKAELWKIK